MARSASATETFTLLIYKQNNAQGPGTYKIPGLLRCNRQYDDGHDSQRGSWLQLCPGLFYQRHADRTTTKKGGRALNAQFDDIEIITAGNPIPRIDYKG